MKIHILSNPNRPTTTKYADYDPFAIITHEYVHNMGKLGYEIIHYGLEGSEVDCQHHSLSNNLVEFNNEASALIGKNKSPDDIIACFYGIANKPATDQHTDIRIVEPAIGYDSYATFARYKVFKSYAHMHFYYGTKNVFNDPDWYDAVIPWGRDPKDFEFNKYKKDYFLYFGRICESKGVRLAIDATRAAGVDLIIAGPGSLQEIGYEEIPNHVKVVGVCNSVERKELMKHAKGLIGLTQYLEPFGLMIIESYFSGTPVITTDWGAFAETVVHNKTGYRCRNFREILDAIEKISTEQIDPIDCYNYALKNYSNDVIFNKHDRYIKRIFSHFY